MTPRCEKGTAMTSDAVHRRRAGGARRLLTALGMTAIAATGAMASTAAAQSENSTTKGSGSSDFAKRVYIGDGRSMYVECRGTGSPTVLLLSGSDLASDSWHAADQKGPKVFSQVAKTTRVCAYDRPGTVHLTGEYSRSDPVPQPTTVQASVDDLDALLATIDEPGPYVLAAHSLAGNIARVFAAQHPDEVEGIVFVDVLTPELRAQMTPEEWEIWKDANARPADDIAEYPPLERQDFDVILDQVEAATPLRPMPVVVLTASKTFAELVPEYLDEGLLPAEVPRDFGEVIDRTNTAAQNELADLVPGAVHITNTKSGHNIMIENAPVVIRSIRQVVDAVRAGTTSLAG